MNHTLSSSKNYPEHGETTISGETALQKNIKRLLRQFGAVSTETPDHKSTVLHVSEYIKSLDMSDPTNDTETLDSIKMQRDICTNMERLYQDQEFDEKFELSFYWICYLATKSAWQKELDQRTTNERKN